MSGLNFLSGTLWELTKCSLVHIFLIGLIPGYDSLLHSASNGIAEGFNWMAGTEIIPTPELHVHGSSQVAHLGDVPLSPGEGYLSSVSSDFNHHGHDHGAPIPNRSSDDQIAEMTDSLINGF